MTDPAGSSTDENPTVRYEETLAIRDDEGAGSLVKWIRIVVAFLIVSSFVSVVLVTIVAIRGMATSVSGLDVLGEFLSSVVGARPAAVAAIVATGLLFVLIGVAFVWLFVKNVGRAMDKTVHVTVSDDGVTVEREGSQYWQSSGVDIPFETITAVEYVDPRTSSMRVELGDWRASKFFAGRSRNWIRLERAQSPAVYVGSDRPQELAATIARRVPGTVTATPY